MKGTHKAIYFVYWIEMFFIKTDGWKDKQNLMYTLIDLVLITRSKISVDGKKGISLKFISI